MNERIGTYKDDGSIEWPKRSLSGVLGYSKQATRRGIGDKRFVVIDIGLSAQDEARLIEELKKPSLTNVRSTQQSTHKTGEIETDDSSKPTKGTR